MKMMRRSVMMLLLMLAFLGLHAQPMAVSGTVIDAVDGHCLAGASVSADGMGVTVVTNADGFFTLKTDSLPASLIVTHLGYALQRCPLHRVGDKLLIRLRPASIRLSEVLVVAEDPRQLVMAAIERISQNFSTQPELHHAFYREAVMKRQHHVSVAEGIVDLYKTSYARQLSIRDRVAIRKGRRLLSPRRSDTLSVKVNGGPVGAVLLDVVKNHDLLLTADELNLYNLKMDVPQDIADRPQYVVQLSPRATANWPLYYGKLYIDQETLAFTRADLSLDMSDRDKAVRAMLVKKPLGVRFRPKELSLLVDYRRGDDGLWRLGYVRTTFRFNCDWRRRLFATAFTASCEMVVTSTTRGTDVQPIRGRDSFDQRDAFFDKVEFFRDSTFWQHYNIIEPTQSLDRDIERIMRRY